MPLEEAKILWLLPSGQDSKRHSTEYKGIIMISLESRGYWPSLFGEEYIKNCVQQETEME